MEDMLQEEQIEKEETNWSAKKSLGLGAFLIVGIIIVGFGLWQFSYRIKAPFLGKGGGLTTFKSLNQKEMEKMIEKQKKDTDGDGLTDFDEEYVYKTSAYLEDSDSDGFPDKVEIDTGNDPNCPSGKDCGIAIAGEGSDSSGEIVLPSAEEFLSGGATPDMIREALRQSGASAEMLATVDDQALLDAYAEVVKETGGGKNIESNGEEDSAAKESESEAEKEGKKTITTEADIAKLTPAEIRQLLLETGMDEATLNSIDDETLMEVLQEALKEVKN